MSNLTTPISLVATQYTLNSLNIDLLSSTITVQVQLLSSNNALVDTRLATDTRINFGIVGTTPVNQLIALVTTYLQAHGVIN